jgi:hypothetical protein
VKLALDLGLLPLNSCLLSLNFCLFLSGTSRPNGGLRGSPVEVKSD